MAKIVLVGLQKTAAEQIRCALAGTGHRTERHSQNVALDQLSGADIVFAGGEPASYLALLSRVRQWRPALPFVVVTRIPETERWLDALEAGASDYCAEPIGVRQLHWLMESSLPRPTLSATA